MNHHRLQLTSHTKSKKHQTKQTGKRQSRTGSKEQSRAHSHTGAGTHNVERSMATDLPSRTRRPPAAVMKGHHPGARSRSCKKYFFFWGIPSNRQQMPVPTQKRGMSKRRSTVVYCTGEGSGEGARERGHPHLSRWSPMPVCRHSNGCGRPASREEGREGLPRRDLPVPRRPGPPRRGPPSDPRRRRVGRPLGLWLPRRGLTVP
jgi:hypothetical protein